MPPGHRDASLARLAEMPGELSAAASRLGEERALEPPPGGGFCMVEQAWHLADLEREGFGARISRLLREDAPFLPDFDGARLARERDYRGRTLADGLAAFAAARSANLACLRAVPQPAWEREG
ncbi:MAG TPA: DinB family protein, partial [Methylomirabilota bacterium]|nr:DinB family protein [Methylomirabilota bacterium]